MTVEEKGQPQADTATIKRMVEFQEIDLGGIAEEQNAGNQKDIIPKDKLKFAQRVLLAIFYAGDSGEYRSNLGRRSSWNRHF